jgi:hypothetical protein
MTEEQNIDMHLGGGEKSAWDELFGENLRVKDEIEKQGYAITEPMLWIFDKDALKVQPKPLYRIDVSNKRFYYTFLDKLNTVPKFFISVTSSIAGLNLLPTKHALIEWYTKFPTMDIAKKELNKLADFGTFDHIIIANFAKEQIMDLEIIPDLTEKYRRENDLDYDNRYWIKYVQRDLIALDHWIKEHEVKPIAIELMLCGNEGYATMVDFICEMTIGTGANGKILKKDIKDGTCERINAIIDWKSMLSFTKDKSFHKTNEFQLEACRRLVKENFPELRIDKLFNISFKNGIRNAEVVMQEQTGKALGTTIINDQEVSEFDLYWEIFKIQNPDYNNPNDIDDVRGYVRFKDQAYQINPKSIKEIVVNKHRKATP